jgi:hypothetical protein
MRRVACLSLSLLLLACSGSDDQPDAAAGDSAAAAVPAPAAPALTIADVSGTWNMQAMTETSDSVILTYIFNAAGDTSTWSNKFPDQAEPVRVHIVSIAGDSMVTHSGPYPSALRRGVMVETNGVMRIENGTLVGRNVAHYKGGGPDSVRVFRGRGTRQ